VITEVNGSIERELPSQKTKENEAKDKHSFIPKKESSPACLFFVCAKNLRVAEVAKKWMSSGLCPVRGCQRICVCQ
jgi:hypothetical protein